MGTVKAKKKLDTIDFPFKALNASGALTLRERAISNRRKNDFLRLFFVTGLLRAYVDMCVHSLSRFEQTARPGER